MVISSMSDAKQRAFIPLGIAVLTVSDSRDEASDKSGRLLADRLQQTGHHLADKRIVRDDIYHIRYQSVVRDR